MPVVSLRMSVGEHELLRGWAADSRRSMQREIIFRLFDGALTEREVDAVTLVDGVGQADGQLSESGASRSESARDETPRKKDFLEDRFGPLKRDQ